VGNPTSRLELELSQIPTTSSRSAWVCHVFHRVWPVLRGITDVLGVRPLDQGELNPQAPVNYVFGLSRLSVVW